MSEEVTDDPLAEEVDHAVYAVIVERIHAGPIEIDRIASILTGALAGVIRAMAALGPDDAPAGEFMKTFHSMIDPILEQYETRRFDA